MPTEEEIAAMGLFPYRRQHLREFPPELYPYCGRGIGLWQYPNQFAPYLDMMIPMKISTYVEIGVAAGGTFMATNEILKPSKRSVAIDVAPVGKTLGAETEKSPYDGVFEAYLAAADPEIVSFFRGTAAEFAAGDEKCPESIDLLFIDGDHSYEGVRADFEALGPRSRVVVFHDIVSDACPGVVRFWNEISEKNKNRTRTFVDQYASVDGSYLGIGVLVREEFGDARDSIGGNILDTNDRSRVGQ